MDISGTTTNSSDINIFDFETENEPSGSFSMIQEPEHGSGISIINLPSTSSSASASSPVHFFNFKSPTSTADMGKQGKSSGGKKRSEIKSFLDNLPKKEEGEINELMGKFFYGCNIPFSVIDSDPFKTFIKKLRPAYAEKMPGRKSLSTTMLDNEYQKQIQRGSSLIGPESVLLIDGWKNTSSNCKTVTTMLHNSTGEQIFLNAWNLSGESETGDRLSAIVDESIDQAKKTYNTTVYAVVSDNAASMLKMGRTVSIWHSNCSAHTANLLAKDILDKKLVEKVTSILKEFRHVDLETSILAKGGTKIKIPIETRWCSHRDSFDCLKKNLHHMRQVVADPKFTKIKQNTKQLIFDDSFIDQVGENIELLDPICTLINKAQDPKCSIADVADIWLSIQPPSCFEHLKDTFKSRATQALNIYVLCAFYLHPFYKNEKLNSEQMNSINDFLMDTLNAEGLREWDLFIRREGYFNLLMIKNVNDPYLFWRMASLKYPNISKLALQLLSIPASSAQIERVFSNWSYVHSNSRNRLTFERSKKLVHVYHNLKINDSNLSDEY